MLLRLSILAAEANGAVAEEEVTNPIIPVGKEILWAFVFVSLLYLAMRYVLVPPLQRLIAERDEKIRTDLEAAELTKDELMALRVEYDAALAAARAEGDQIVAAQRAEADAYRARLQRDAESQIASARQAAQAEIAAARTQALQQVRSEVVELAVSAASRVIETPVDRSSAVAAVERALTQVGGSQS